MVDAPTTREKPRRNPTDPLGFSALALDELAQLLPTRDGRRPRVDRVDRDDRVYRWALRRAYAARSSGFRTTIAQAARGSGYPCSGSRDDDVARFGNNVRRALDSLQRAGVLRWRPLRRPDGRYWCLWVQLLPSAVPDPERAPWRRRGRFNRRELVPDELAAPRRPSSVRRVRFTRRKCHLPRSTPSGYIGKRGLRARASAHAPNLGGRSTRKRPRDRHEGKDRGGARAQARAHRALVRVFESSFRAPARFSEDRWGPKLDRALARLDRYADFGRGREGAGVEYAAAMIEATAAEIRAPAGWWDDPPSSLAYFVPILDSVSKDWRRVHRSRRAVGKSAGGPGAPPEKGAT